MFAVNWLELLKVVELTVTPPGLVVPLRNHWAFAPFLNPFPLTVTFRLIVPCGAALGLVEETWIWPVAGWASRKVSITIKAEVSDQQNLDFICSPHKEL